MAYLVNIEHFYGPLDLLLYLIEEKEMDIYDVPLAPIIDQFLEYIESAGDIELDNRTDFLKMASYLMNIKSALLLPKAVNPDNREEAGEEEDPREELLQRILLYKKYKEAAGYLSSRQAAELERVFFRPSATLPITEESIFRGDAKSLWQAMQNLRKRKEAEASYNIPFNDVKVEAKMQELIDLLQKNKRVFFFKQLLSVVQNKKELLAFFLGVLELVKMQIIEAEQAEEDGDIVITLQVKN